MNPDKVLLIDCNNICHQAAHTPFGDLTKDESPVAVIYGFLLKLSYLSSRFFTTNFVFCFDDGKPIRSEYYQQYKAKRNEANKEPEAKARRKKMFQQMTRLREEILPDIGFRNILSYPGFEADDIIASLCKSKNHFTEYVIVSTDKDMFQLLEEYTWMLRGGKLDMYTIHDLWHDYGLRPHQWAEVKALCGCSTDGVKGIVGIGEKTAIQYVLETMKPGVKMDRIESVEGLAIAKRNLKLVQLPYKGTPKNIILQEDELSIKKWKRVVVKRLGMKSLAKDAMIKIRSSR